MCCLRPLLITCIVLSLHFTSSSQDIRTCGWDHAIEIRKSADPLFDYDKFIKPHLENLKLRSGARLVTIPVVFHVIHTGTPEGIAENVSTQLLMAQLDQINLDFRRLNPDRVNTPAEFQGVAADVEIEFCLAQQDPAGFPTSGINRYNFGFPDYSPEELKHVAQSKTTWDRDSYLNIWVADLRGYLGYAYLPGGDAIGDGLTLDYVTVGSMAQPNPVNTPFAFGRTATHEIAHWLGLDHHWAVHQNCTSDDGVGDTPRQYGYYVGTPSYPQNSCNSSDMFMNFLDYVDDVNMNLYTQGQKNVMHSVLNSIRDGLAYSKACDPPSPVVMFDQSQSVILEGTKNCPMGQKRITVEVKIAAAPSRTATVNLKVGGNAINNEDYQLSKSSLRFPAGSTSSQYVDIVVFEDAYVEGMKELELTYSISAGGGNAKAGTEKQMHLVKIINDDWDALPASSMSQKVGSNMGGSATPSPFKGRHSDARTQYIFTKDELEQVGLIPGWITALTFFVTQKRSSGAYRDFRIKMGLTDQTEFNEYPGFYSGLTEVFHDDVATVAGNLKLQLQTPYWWDGQSNLTIQTCFDNTSKSSDDQVTFENTYPNHRIITEGYNNSIGCQINFMPTRTTLRPVIEFEIDYGCEVASSVNVTNGYADCEFGPQQTVHFYDAQSHEIMMSIRNLSQHDYGCTRVEIDEEGNSATSLWGSTYDRTSKTFMVSPDNNNPNGRFEVSLYYSSQEVSGWENNNQQRQSANQLRLTKCSQPLGQSSSQQCLSISTQMTDFGDGKKFTGTFTNGFSGFTVSNWPNSPLALEALTLKGQIIENNSVQLEILDEDIPEDCNLEWYRSENGGSPILIHHSSSNESLSHVDKILTQTEHVAYMVKMRMNGRTITSNWIDFTIQTEWTAATTSARGIFVFNAPPSSQFIVCNLLGNDLATFNGDEVFNAEDLPSGLYIVRSAEMNDREVQKVFLP